MDKHINIKIGHGEFAVDLPTMLTDGPRTTIYLENKRMEEYENYTYLDVSSDELDQIILALNTARDKMDQIEQANHPIHEAKLVKIGDTPWFRLDEDTWVNPDGIQEDHSNIVSSAIKGEATITEIKE